MENTKLNPEELIDVWQIWPHMDTSFDYAVFDDSTKAIEYLQQVAEMMIDGSVKDETYECKIVCAQMTRADYWDVSEA
jgi:hypothetical protein